MQTGYSIRLYLRPSKLFEALMVISLFLFIGIDILRRDPTNPIYVLAASVILVPAGLLALLLLARLAYGSLLRRPALEINERGWHARLPSIGGAQSLDWSLLEQIGCYVRHTQSGASYYYLAVKVKDSTKLRHSVRRRLAIRLVPDLRECAAAVQLNGLIPRCTTKKREKLLEYIATVCAHEIQLYGIEVQQSVRDMTPKARKDRT